jgi:hypothetical protein
MMDKKLKGYASKFLPEGEVKVKVFEDGSTEDIPWEPTELSELPRKFREKHAKAMIVLSVSIAQVREKNREIPVLRDELEQMGVSKSLLRDLQDMGMVKCQAIRLLERKSQKAVGDRVVVFPTPMGRALLKGKAHAAANTTLS